ncbi:FecR family protein, partial [Rhodocaloribacter sp.]
LARRLDAPHRRSAADHRPRRPGRLRPTVLVPAAVAVLLAVAFGWWSRPATIVAPPGEQRIVRLPDGSTAQLNSASRLRYARGFRAWPFAAVERRVTLEGEAFFEVEHDGRAFVVETFNARVEVLGTRFNVRARREPTGPETRVLLASGRVRVIDERLPDRPILLSEAGQAARITARPATTDTPAPKVESLERALAWRNRGFTAVEEPLSAILAEMERRYALTFEAEPGIALTDSLTLFYMRPVTAEEILHDICLARNCRYRETSRGFVLFAPETPPTP